MILPYEQFKKIVPKETLEFVSKVLPYLDYYSNNHALCFKSRFMSFKGDTNSLLLLYCLSLL